MIKRILTTVGCMVLGFILSVISLSIAVVRDYFPVNAFLLFTGIMLLSVVYCCIKLLPKQRMSLWMAGVATTVLMVASGVTYGLIEQPRNSPNSGISNQHSFLKSGHTFIDFRLLMAK